jgi:hypothetical protein
MDDFLANLYAEEQEKVAAADLGAFMGTLPTDELEEFLGLYKLGVAGPENPELPAGSEQFDKDQKKTEAEVAKLRGESPTDRNEEKTAASTQHTYESGVIPLSPRRGAAGGAIPGALLGGAGLGGAGYAVGGARGAALGGLLGTAIGGGAGAGIGAGLSALKRSKVKSDQLQIDKMNKQKQSQGIGDVGMGGGGMGGGGMGGGMETTASAKAKIAMRTLRAAAGAPPHIKLAAAKLAGREMAKVATARQNAAELQQILNDRNKEKVSSVLEKMAFTLNMRSGDAPLDPDVAAAQGARAGRMGGGLLGLGSGTAIGKQLGGTKGAILGAGLGTASGILGGHLIGKSSGKRGSELQRARELGDMRQRIEMARQLSNEYAGM